MNAPLPGWLWAELSSVNERLTEVEGALDDLATLLSDKGERGDQLVTMLSRQVHDIQQDLGGVLQNVDPITNGRDKGNR